MIKKTRFAGLLLLVALLFHSLSALAATELTVFKSPTCGCCTVWMEHLEQRDFAVSSQHPDDLDALKQRLNIKPQYQSCHTAVSVEGYVFEGHVPAALIKRFLAEKPKDAIGLAVPGMPIGSPGMEVGERFQPYEVLLLKKDGSIEVYEKVKSLKQFK